MIRYCCIYISLRRVGLLCRIEISYLFSYIFCVLFLCRTTHSTVTRTLLCVVAHQHITPFFCILILIFLQHDAVSLFAFEEYLFYMTIALNKVFLRRIHIYTIFLRFLVRITTCKKLLQVSTWSHGLVGYDDVCPY